MEMELAAKWLPVHEVTPDHQAALPRTTLLPILKHHQSECFSSGTSENIVFYVSLFFQLQDNLV
jgi:hypothetical protein